MQARAVLVAFARLLKPTKTDDLPEMRLADSRIER